MSGLGRILDLPPVWLIGFMALTWYSPAIALPAIIADLGLGLIILGVGLAAWAGLGFRHAQTTIVPRQEPTALVETGPFRFSRNPIYLADLIILAGWSLVAAAPLGLVLVWIFQRVLTRRFIEGEEETLRQHLGAPYEAYCARVRRWI